MEMNSVVMVVWLANSGVSRRLFEMNALEVRNELVERIQAEGRFEVNGEADFIPIASAW